MKFLDQVKIFLKSGNGGPGAISFRREANVPYGGPDGGDGGQGGDIVGECVEGLNTLIDFRYKQHFKAATGNSGSGKNKSGANGKDIHLRLPVGTQVLDEDNETVLADFIKIGEKKTILYGGRGGKGNAWFKSSTRQAPRISQPGELGEETWIWLRLKLIADAGLIGMPNSGKSTFLSKVSAARPKIADYPFTTIYPGLGVVSSDQDEFVIADIPGLIEGAHNGVGLGIRFLGHIERCRVLIHLVDCCDNDPVKSWEVVRKEIKAYGAGLEEKEILTVLTKCDALTDIKVDEVKKKLSIKCKSDVYSISSVSGKGLNQLLRQTKKIITKNIFEEKDE
tara:strand:- start:94 stop:1104 length:1011 start_codon:yes stop_codon:yes gene_type:complete